MVAHFTMRTYEVYQEFRFVEGIWLHQKSRQIRFFFQKKKPTLPHTCATCSRLPSKHPSYLKMGESVNPAFVRHLESSSFFVVLARHSVFASL